MDKHCTEAFLKDFLLRESPMDKVTWDKGEFSSIASVRANLNRYIKKLNAPIRVVVQRDKVYVFRT